MHIFKCVKNVSKHWLVSEINWNFHENITFWSIHSVWRTSLLRWYYEIASYFYDTLIGYVLKPLYFNCKLNLGELSKSALTFDMKMWSICLLAIAKPPKSNQFLRGYNCYIIFGLKNLKTFMIWHIEKC